jgi:hypothetical protein
MPGPADVDVVESTARTSAEIALDALPTHIPLMDVAAEIAELAYTHPPRFLKGAPRAFGKKSTMFHTVDGGSWSLDTSCAIPAYEEWRVIGCATLLPR